MSEVPLYWCILPAIPDFGYSHRRTLSRDRSSPLPWIQGYLAYKNGFSQERSVLEFFLFLFSRTYHRQFFENVHRNKNVPPTVFSALLKFQKNRPQIAYTPGEWSWRIIFGAKTVPTFPSKKNGFPRGGAFKIRPAEILRKNKNRPFLVHVLIS